MAGAKLGTSRLLLSKVRDVMAATAEPQERLNRLVETIAQGLNADVCSVYVMRAGNILELFATKGLKAEAVHNTRLRVGEGLIGEIAVNARSVTLADAQSHPSYIFRPETGEEKYHSLMGVPIVRGGHVIGVLAVQHVEHSNYSDEEVETLETVGMILAELVAGGGLIEAGELTSGGGIGILPLRLEGIRINGGLASGLAVIHEPRIVINQPVAEDPDVEMARLNQAMSSMNSSLNSLFSSAGLDEGHSGDILETYRMFAQDRGWNRRIHEAVATGLTAEAAVQKVQEDTRVRMSQIADPYLRERLLDFDDLANRLIRHLSGDVRTSAGTELPENVILVARSMGPADLLDYEPGRLRALILEEGSQTSHVAIIARDMDIPVLSRVKDALSRIDAGEPVIVDADNEQIIVRPGDDALQVYKKNMRARAQRLAVYETMRDVPAVTLDGTRINLHINAGLLADLPQLHNNGADGIGLYGPEIPFMVRSTFPDVAAQTKLYRKVLDQADGKPVVFRTLDIGGDKMLPYMRMEEDNPAMGWRSIRIGLDRPAMLRKQLRAMVYAASGRQLQVTFPMVSEIDEFKAARDLLERELSRAQSRGQEPPREVRIGCMVEVPLLIWQLPKLLPLVDFISIGSNDLVQFLFASDRGNPNLSGRYDAMSPPVLTCFRQIAQVCDEAQTPVTVCGEMAGQPVEAMALIGLGYRNLSMGPSSVGPVKYMAMALETGPLREHMETLMALSAHSVRNLLRSYARDHEIVV